MLRNLAAYLIAFFLAPTLGALTQLVLLPIIGLLMPKAKDGNPRTPARIWTYALLSGLASIAGGFAAIWFSMLVFRWLQVKPTIAIAWVLGVGYVLNDGRELIASQGEMVIPRFSRTVGDLLGVVLGATRLL